MIKAKTVLLPLLTQNPATLFFPVYQRGKYTWREGKIKNKINQMLSSFSILSVKKSASSKQKKKKRLPCQKIQYLEFFPEVVVVSKCINNLSLRIT